jgi:2-iminobutanoate/2-iminopropanoate deaminase
MEVSVTKRQIVTTSAPAAMAVYSQAIDANGFVFCAGQIGLDPAGGELPDGVQAQAERVLKNLQGVLEAAGLSLADVVKTTCFLADIADFQAFNEVYARFFPETPPARSTFAVAALPRGARIEVEAIAARPSV